jgi:hypothetical protein
MIKRFENQLRNGFKETCNVQFVTTEKSFGRAMRMKIGLKLAQLPQLLT